MIALASHHRQPVAVVRAWELTEGLALYREIERARVAAEYHNDCLVWATLAPHKKKPGKPPAVPPLLR